MKVQDIVESLGLAVLSPARSPDAEVTGGYASDLLSDVIARGRAGDVWITMQTHVNIVAVASLKDLAAVVLVNGRAPDPETLAKAQQEKVTILGSQMSAFELAGRLYELGIRGSG